MDAYVKDISAAMEIGLGAISDMDNKKGACAPFLFQNANSEDYSTRTGGSLGSTAATLSSLGFSDGVG